MEYKQLFQNNKPPRSNSILMFKSLAEMFKFTWYILSINLFIGTDQSVFLKVNVVRYSAKSIFSYAINREKYIYRYRNNVSVFNPL